ncbi:MAG: hypothetical protein ACRDQ0_16715, partial [Pseudonocardia sp.]
DLTYLITHASYGGSAVLFTDSELSGVLGYDRACHDLLDFDLAYALRSFCRPPLNRRHGAWIDSDRCQRFMRAHRSEAPVNDADLWALPLVMRAQELAAVVRKCENLLGKHATKPRQTRDALRFAELLAGEAIRLRWLTENVNDIEDLALDGRAGA